MMVYALERKCETINRVLIDQISVYFALDT